jgi:tape measure domain-containing protein
MADDGQILIGIKLDKKDLEKGLSQFKSSAERGFDILNSAAIGVGLAIGAVATSIGVLGFNYAKEMENANAAFTVLLASADKAKNMLADLEKFANSTPFDMPGVTKASKTLLAFGVDANDLMPTLKMLGDVSLGNSQYFQQLALVFGQVQANGKLMGQDLLQMVNVGFNPLEYISKRTGQSMSELRSEMEKGAITTDMVKQAFIDATAEGGRFNGSLEEYAKTWSGRWSTMMDTFGKFSGKILKPIYEFIRDKILPVVTDFMNAVIFEIDTNGWKNYIKILEEISAYVIPLTVAFLALKLAMDISSVITAIKASIAIFGGPVTIIIGLIGLIIGVIVQLWLTNEEFRKAVTDIWNKIVQMFKDSAKWIVDTWNATIKLFQELPGRIWTWLVAVIDLAIAWRQSLRQNIIDGISNIINTVVAWFAQLPGRIWTWLVETVNKVSAWISNLGSKMSSGISGIINSVVSWFAQLPGRLYSVGSDIVHGVWNGIAGAAGWLYNQVAGWASNILTTIKKAMGIASPSKITANYGKYLAQGLGIGFGDEISNVYKDMNNAINLQNAKLNWSVQAGNSYNNVMSKQDINVNGTYTSNIALDGNLLATSINQIDQRRTLQYGY